MWFLDEHKNCFQGHTGKIEGRKSVMRPLPWSRMEKGGIHVSCVPNLFLGSEPSLEPHT